MRLLVIEDDEVIADSLGQALTKDGYSVDVARDGETGLKYANAHQYGLILLDLMLPGRDGFSVCGRGNGSWRCAASARKAVQAAPRRPGKRRVARLRQCCRHGVAFSPAQPAAVFRPSAASPRKRSAASRTAAGRRGPKPIR